MVQTIYWGHRERSGASPRARVTSRAKSTYNLAIYSTGLDQLRGTCIRNIVAAVMHARSSRSVAQTNSLDSTFSFITETNWCVSIDSFIGGEGGGGDVSGVRGGKGSMYMYLHVVAISLVR